MRGRGAHGLFGARFTRTVREREAEAGKQGLVRASPTARARSAEWRRSRLRLPAAKYRLSLRWIMRGVSEGESTSAAMSGTMGITLASLVVEFRGCQQGLRRAHRSSVYLLPRRSHALAVELAPFQINVRNPLRIGDVIERIRVEHDEVGALSGLERSTIG